MNKFRLVNSLKRKQTKQGFRLVETGTVLPRRLFLKLAQMEKGYNLTLPGYKWLRVSYPHRSLELVKLNL